MNINIVARKLKIGDDIKKHVRERMNKLDMFFAPDISAITGEVEFERNTHHQKGKVYKCQITVWVAGRPMRREREATSPLASFDLAYSTILRLAKRHKNMAHGRPKSRAPKKAAVKQVVRRKELDLKPMYEQEAIDQLELLGHDFMLYLNEDGKHRLIYRRKAGGYGILEF